MTSPPRFVLHLAAAADAEALFPRLPWGAAWDEVCRDDTPAVKARFQLSLDAAAALTPGFACSVPLTTALWCRDADLLAPLRALSGVTVIFAPGPVTSLDAHRRGRHTLRLKAAVRSGDILESHHLDVQVGGSGIDADLAAHCVGRPAAYDLAAGEALDFGKIL